MIESGELGRYLGYTAGWNLSAARRAEVTRLAASDEVQDGRSLAVIVKRAMPELPRGMRDGGPHGVYSEEFKSNFLAGAKREK